MAVEKRQTFSPGPTEDLDILKVSPDRDLRRAESSLARAEGLLERALDDGDALGDAACRLTLAQWNLGQRGTLRHQWPRQAAILVAAMAATVYLTYRLFWTMNLTSTPAAIFSAMLLAAEFYAGMSLGLFFFQVWRLVEPPLRRPTAGRTVDVFVATYNEDVALLRGTLAACVAMEYPHTTYILDDGARDEVRQLAESLGVRYISRTDRTHAKAGNLNNALRQTNGEFVVILDADHVPYRHYITRLIGYFDDPQIGFVQTPHTTYNLNNFLGRWKTSSKGYWEDVRIFFEAVQLGKNRYGVACFCGSAAIMRRKSLEDVGLFATETITEDLHTGMRINAAGWKSIAVSEEMVVGLAPTDAATFCGQRLRWGEGNLSVLAYDNPLTMKGLTLPGRINYFASIASWTFGPARLVMYLTPLVMLLSGIAPVADMSIVYGAVVGCYLLSTWAAVKIASNRCGELLGIELAMMASFHLQLQALWRALFHRRRQKFVVTAKRGNGKPSVLRQMWPQAALVAISLVAVSWAASRVAFHISDDYLGLFIGSGLAGYHAWLALTILGRAASKNGRGDEWRHPACLAVDYTTDDAMKAAVSLEFNENECQLLTWERLEQAAPLDVVIHTPVGDATVHGRVVTSTPLGGRDPFAYLNEVAFVNADPQQRENESDSLRRIAMRYVVPVVTMAHRLVRREHWPSPEGLCSEGDLPVPLAIDARLPNMAVQKAVALAMSTRGFGATLEYPCPIGNVVQVMLSTPLGPILTEANVQDVQSIRIGSAIVYQHEFRWRDNLPLRQLMSRRRTWASQIDRAISRLRRRRLPLAQIAMLQLAACVLVVLTALTFGKVKHDDIVLASATGHSLNAAETAEVEGALEHLANLPDASTDRLLRIYTAATAIRNHTYAAKAAEALANHVKKDRAAWMLTSARHLMQKGDYRAADAAFDEMLAKQVGRELPPEERADIYVEAARAALAMKHLDKAAARFLVASHLKATDPEQAREFLGTLIAAGETKLALQVLDQMDRSDRVLRQIVDVHEIAKQPELAMPELKELQRRHPDDMHAGRRLAELAVMRRDFAAGMDYYRSLWKAEPNNKSVKSKLAETMLLQARAYVAAGQLDRAFALYDESFALQPPDNQVKREFGGVLAKAGRFDRAIGVLDPLIDAESQLLLASLLEMQGQRQRSLDILLGLEKSQTIGNEAEQRIVRLLLANQKYHEAADRLVDLMKKDPDDLRLRREFIDAVAASGHWSDAVRRATIDVFRKYQGSGFQTLDAEGFERLGDALIQLRLFEEAGAELSLGVARFPEVRSLRLRLAQTLGELGRYDDAEMHYKTLLDKRASLRR